jgi:uncharacterized protein YbcI
MPESPDSKGGDPDPRGPEDPGGGEEMGDRPTEQKVRSEVGREVLRIYEESYGGGAGKADAFVSEDWVVVALDDLHLLPNEQFLVDSGEQDAVRLVRSQYQRAIQMNLRAAVERATGRTVIGFASATSVDESPFAVEIFKLE